MRIRSLKFGLALGEICLVVEGHYPIYVNQDGSRTWPGIGNYTIPYRSRVGCAIQIGTAIIAKRDRDIVQYITTAQKN